MVQVMVTVLWWWTEHSHLRSLAFDITQHIIFKRGVAFLVLANCSLLAVPVTDHFNHALA